MALIKCVKCGEEYSNTLSSCPHCQFIPEFYVCPECHSPCRKTDASCWRCGNPVDTSNMVPASEELIQKLHDTAASKLESAESLKDWEKLDRIFVMLGSFGDAVALHGQCAEKILELQNQEKHLLEYQALQNQIEITDSYIGLEQLLQRLEGFAGFEGVEELTEKCHAKWQEAAYEAACGTKKPVQAKAIFDRLGEYRDSKEKAAECEGKAKANAAKIKRIAIICGIIAAIIIAVIIVVNMYIIPKGNYDKGVDAYKAKKYAAAIEYFNKADGFSDSEKYLKKCNYRAGMDELENGFYYEAAEYLKSAGNYKDAKINLKYCRAVIKLEDGDYSDAYNDFVELGDFRESKYMMNACSLMEAEEYYQDGDLEFAQELYEDLPKMFKYNGITVKDRLDLLKKYEDFFGLCGNHSLADSYMEVKQTHDSTGIWENWYSEDPGGELYLECRILDNGKLHITGTASFWIYTEYSSLESIVSDHEYYKTVYIDETVSSMPNNLEIGEYTKMTVSGDKIKINYYNYSPNEDVYFTYLYKTDMTFNM